MPNIGRKASANSIGVLKRIEPPHSERISAVRITTDGIEMIIVVVWKNAAIVVPMPVMNMWCAQTMNDMKPEEDQRVDHRAVAPERLAGVVGDHLGHDAHRRQDQHVDLGVGEEPEQVLPEQRVAAAARPASAWPLTTRPVGRKKLVPASAVHELQDAAASSGGKASSSRNEVTNCAQHEERQPQERQALAPAAGSW